MLQRMQLALASYLRLAAAAQQQPEDGNEGGKHHPSPHRAFALSSCGFDSAASVAAVHIEGNSRLSINAPEPRPCDLSMAASEDVKHACEFSGGSGVSMSEEELHEILDQYFELLLHSQQ